MRGHESCEPLLESHAPAASFRKRRHSERAQTYSRGASAVRWRKSFEAMESISHPKRLKRTHTAVIFICIFTLGLVSAVLGGTLDDLQDIYGIHAAEASKIIVTRSAGILFGSLFCGGFLYKHVNAKIVIIVSLLAGGLGTAIVPDVAPLFWIAHMGQFVLGTSIGALEVGCNVWLVQLWEEGVNPMMQSYHVSYGIGALLAPLMAAPFLGPERNHTMNATVQQQLQIFELEPEPQVNVTSNIAVPYGIYGGAYSFMGLVILFFFMIDRTELRQQPAPVSDEVAQKSANRFEWLIVSLLSTYIIVTVTFESIISNMLAIYVNRNSDLNMDKTEGNYLLAFYWATYTTGRISSIFISYKLKPNTILVAAQTIASLGAGVLFLLVFPATTGRGTVWFAAGIIGFGIAPLYPTAFTWAVRYIHLKFVHMSIILVASCLGALMPTYLVAPWVEQSITALPAVVGGCGLVLICILITMLFTTRNRSPIYERDDARNLLAHPRDRGIDQGDEFSLKGERL